MKRELLSVAMVGVTMVAGVVLSILNVRADDAVSTATITVPVACTMSGSGMDSHIAEVPNGTTVENIGTTTMKIYCNDNEGFSVYAAGFSNDTLGNTYLRDATLGQTDDILTGTTFSGANSAWAMKIGATAGTYASTIAGSSADTEKESGDTDFSDWAEIPSAYTRVAYRNSGTDVDNVSAASAEGSSITATYKAYVSTTQKSGTYVGKVKYTMVHPASEEPLQPQPSTAGCINYFANASDALGTMGCQSATDGSLKTLLASNFSRTGYGFAGWSDAYDYTTNTSAHFYGPQETITVPTGTTANGLSLYAVWVKSAGGLQDTNKVAELCGTGTNALITAPTDGTANLRSVSALTDQRDNETYAIAKLADGNCWMIENLRLESTNSDNSTGNLAQGYGASTTYGNFSGLADAESTGFSSTYTANSLYYSGTQEGTASIDIATSNYPAYRMPRYNNINTSTRASSPTSNGVAMYSYGNYYTWHAAIADLTYNGTDNQSTTNTSLCPTGWHLPTGGLAYASGSTSGVNVAGDTSTFREFYNLGYKTMDEVKTAYEDTPNDGYAYYSSYTTNTAGKTATATIRSFPNNFLYSGSFGTSSATSRGNNGYYWSSTANSSISSYYLTLNSSYVYPGTGRNNGYNGYSIRCTVSAGT